MDSPSAADLAWRTARFSEFLRGRCGLDVRVRWRDGKFRISGPDKELAAIVLTTLAADRPWRNREGTK